MPYPRAYLYLAGLFAAAIVAFWPNYFSKLDEVSLAFHLHGVTASAWMLLLISQSWAIHHGPFALHRWGGRFALVLAPVFIAGGLMVIQTMQIARNPFYDLYAVRLAGYDTISITGFAAFFGAALATRRRPAIHAHFMLAVAFLLLGPVFARLVTDFVPGLTIAGPQDFARFAGAIHLGNILAVLALLALYLRNRAEAWPFLVAALVITAQSAAFEWGTQLDPFVSALEAYQSVPAGWIFAVGLLIGVVVSWAGWVAGRPPRPAAPLAGPA